MRGRRGEKDGIYRLYRLYRTGRSCKAERDLVSGEPWRWLNLIDGVREEVQYLEEGQDYPLYSSIDVKDVWNNCIGLTHD